MSSEEKATVEEVNPEVTYELGLSPDGELLEYYVITPDRREHVSRKYLVSMRALTAVSYATTHMPEDEAIEYMKPSVTEILRSNRLPIDLFLLPLCKAYVYNAVLLRNPDDIFLF